MLNIGKNNSNISVISIDKSALKTCDIVLLLNKLNLCINKYYILNKYEIYKKYENYKITLLIKNVLKLKKI